MKYISEILPVDGFRLTLNFSLPQDYEAALYHLYQPLIGIEAIHLYEFFIFEAKLMTGSSLMKQTHHTLMNHLNMPLNIIYEARLKLEAIGLLQTYKHEDRSGKLYTYNLVAPYSPQQFLNDIMLAELLERHVGSRRFAQLKLYYMEQQTEMQGENITASFNEVFETYLPTDAHISPISPPDNQETQADIKLEPVDFSLLLSALKQRNIPKSRVLTERNERIITQLANLYNLASYELEKALLWALTDENELDIEQFKAACYDFAKTKKQMTPIRLTLKTDKPKQIKSNNKQAMTKIDQLVERLETISPKELLEDLSGGNQATEQDLKMITDIMINQGLTAPVMNVLIHFTMLQTNMMLSRAYMEKVAGHWSRAKLKTAKEAMDFALQQVAPKEQRQNRRGKQERKNTTEVIPEWFNKRHDQSNQEKETSSPKGNQNVEKEMEAIINKYRKNK